VRRQWEDGGAAGRVPTLVTHVASQRPGLVHHR